MKKIGIIVKEATGNRIKESIKKSGSVFLIKYSGVKSPDLCSLRQSLSGINAGFFVVRNSIARRALKDLGRDDLIAAIDGPCGFVFGTEDPVSASRILCDFCKDHEQLKVELGFINDRMLTKQDIQALAKLPSKEVLRAQVVGGLKSPINGLVMVLHQSLRKFVYCLEQIKNKKNS